MQFSWPLINIMSTLFSYMNIYSKRIPHRVVMVASDLLIDKPPEASSGQLMELSVYIMPSSSDKKLVGSKGIKHPILLDYLGS